MKKTLFAALALVSMASCSNEEVLEVAQKEAIGFDNAFINNSTRSVNDYSYSSTADEGKGMISDFHVFAFVEGAAIFDNDVTDYVDGTVVNQTIKNDKLESIWKYDGTQYWIAGANYDFSAVAPSTGWTTTEATKDGVKLSFSNNGKSDILYAKASQQGKISGNEMVAFTFRHILSKVKFSFENAYNATNAKIKVKDIKITNAYTKGNATLNANTVWAAEGEQTLSFGMATDNEATTEKENAEIAYAYQATYESQEELLLIPCSDNKAYNVEFKVVLLVGETEVKEYTHKSTVNFAPAAGCSYDIKAIINAENIDPENKQEPIEFTVNKINGWTSGTNPSDITTTTPAGN